MTYYLRYKTGLTRFRFTGPELMRVFLVVMETPVRELYRAGHEKVVRLPFAFAFGYCINFCIYAMLRTRATFLWPTLYILYKTRAEVEETVEHLRVLY
jgi:hypothetical protein